MQDFHHLSLLHTLPSVVSQPDNSHGPPLVTVLSLNQLLKTKNKPNGYRACAMNFFTKLNLPSSFAHLKQIRSSAYVSPVMMYFPVSPVAPPNRITFDFDTTSTQAYKHTSIHHVDMKASMKCELTYLG